jgi:predicted amidohydrolase
MYRIALAQTCPVTADIQSNLKAFAENIQNAKKENAKLIIFPELALSGYACGDRFFEVAETIPGPSTNYLIELAKKNEIYIIWGMPEKGLEGILYNSAVIVGPEGYVGTWRKHTLPGHATDQTGPGAFPDRRFFRAGTENPIFKTALGTIGIMVCYDTFFPEISRLLTLKGADLLVAISGSPSFEKNIFEPIVKVRAMENTSWFAYCNLAGTENGINYWGGGCVVAPGNIHTKVPGDPIVAKAPYDIPSLTFAEIDYSMTGKFRPYFPVLRDLPLGIYKELSEVSKNIG